MSFALQLLLLVPVLVLSVLDNVVFNTWVEQRLQKVQGRAAVFWLWVGILLFQALLYSWLPARFGFAVELLDGAVVLQAGAFAANLGWMLAVQALLILWALLKLIWAALRKKTSGCGRMILFYLILTAVLGVLGGTLTENETLIGTDGTGIPIALVVLALLCWGLFKKGMRRAN